MGTQSTRGEQNRQYNKHNIISQTNIFLKMSGSRVPVTMRDFFFDDPFFKNSWEDFDKVRDAMFTESRDMWKKFDDDFRNMACMSNNIMLESDSQQQQQEAISNNTESSSNRSLTRQDSKSRWTSLRARTMRSSESKRTTPRWRSALTPASTGQMVSRMFSRKYTLPADAKSEEVASNLSSDGVLVITAPKKQLAIK